MSREQEVRDAIERFIAHVRQETDTHLETLSTELLAIAQGDIRTSRADVERAAVEIARAVAKGGSHARHDLISRVVVAMRRLDDAASLRGILDALADGAAEEASRVAVLLVDQSTLRGYKHHGFAPGVAPAELATSASPLLSSAVNLRQTTVVRPMDDEKGQQTPAFMRVSAGQMGLIIPIVVANAVVALVYADGPDRLGEAPGAAVWNEQVEVLVRHASARLENVTSKRTVEVLANQS
jgi:hypothetical protein